MSNMLCFFRFHLSSQHVIVSLIFYTDRQQAFGILHSEGEMAHSHYQTAHHPLYMALLRVPLLCPFFCFILLRTFVQKPFSLNLHKTCMLMPSVLLSFPSLLLISLSSSCRPGGMVEKPRDEIHVSYSMPSMRKVSNADIT